MGWCIRIIGLGMEDSTPSGDGYGTLASELQDDRCATYSTARGAPGVFSFSCSGEAASCRAERLVL